MNGLSHNIDVNRAFGKLSEVRRELPKLVRDPERWKGLYVTYAPPFVERLWTQFDDDHRVFLHTIHPVPDGAQALWHNHPWPAIVEVIEGSYVMDVGTAEDLVMSTRVVAGCVYTMLDDSCWHNVSPIDSAAMTLMVVGKPYIQASKRKRMARQPSMHAGEIASGLDIWKRKLR